MDTTMVDENPNATLQDRREDDLEDDTFSLSGFSTFRDSSTTTVDSQELLTHEDHSFEFFTSEEWNNSNTNNPFPPETIVFCGNLIPISKQAIPEKTQNLKDNQVRRRDRGDNPSSVEKPQSTKSLAPVEEKRINNLKKGGGKNNVLAHKVSILRSSTKSKWHLYVLGMAKVPAEMELSDIRSRQSRRISPTRRSSSKMLGTRGNGAINHEEGVSVGCSTRSVKGLWGLIRVLGCHDQADTVVKASLVCISGGARV